MARGAHVQRHLGVQQGLAHLWDGTRMQPSNILRSYKAMEDFANRGTGNAKVNAWNYSMLLDFGFVYLVSFKSTCRYIGGGYSFSRYYSKCV
jgi:hypothetical protein